MRIDDLKWDSAGLVTVVVQDRHVGDVRMVAHATREAIEQTLATHEGHFFSRSRKSLWRKGESSGNVLRVAEVWADCDGDAVLYLVDPDGPSCHTGERVCFFNRLDAEAAPGELGEPSLVRLERTLEARRSSTEAKSYTRSLLEKGATAIGAKITEEAGELVTAIESESDERVASEAADLVYHALVGLMFRHRPLRAVVAELARRFNTSGLAEKAARSPKA
jgi:phosphoribosyl-ATP pyrophosphohydrolase/phosphoribosyl-AMP cyclohydrolase